MLCHGVRRLSAANLSPCCAVLRCHVSWCVQVASSKSELMQLLRNMAVGLMPEVLRVADGPPPEPHDFLIRGKAGCETLVGLNKALFVPGLLQGL